MPKRAIRKDPSKNSSAFRQAVIKQAIMGTEILEGHNPTFSTRAQAKTLANQSPHAKKTFNVVVQPLGLDPNEEFNPDSPSN